MSTLRASRCFVRLLAFVAMMALASVRPTLGQAQQFLEVIALSDLDFGTVTSSIGTVTVDKNYLYIGKFQIRAGLAIPPGTFPEVDLTFSPPSVLAGPGSGVPYAVAASTNSVSDDPATSTLVSGTTARISLQISEGSENGLPVFSAFAYVYGTIDVASAASGDYGSPLQLEAEAVFNVPPVCLAAAWQPQRRYHAGDVVTHDGAAWEANRTTKGEEPGVDEVDDGDGNQVTLCHIPPGDPSAQQTITVGQPAVQAHLDHGDHLGTCEDGDAGGGSPWDMIALCN